VKKDSGHSGKASSTVPLWRQVCGGKWFLLVAVCDGARQLKVLDVPSNSELVSYDWERLLACKLYY
jgi:hypothetical protein